MVMLMPTGLACDNGGAEFDLQIGMMFDAAYRLTTTPQTLFSIFLRLGNASAEHKFWLLSFIMGVYPVSLGSLRVTIDMLCTRERFTEGTFFRGNPSFC